MNTRNNIEKLWEYILDEYETEELSAAVEEFEFDTNQLEESNLDSLSEEESRSLLFNLGYMVVNGLFGGNFHMWNEVLTYSLEFDEETIDFLNY